VRAEVIPLSVVRVDDEAERLLLQVVRSGRLTQGPMVERLERDFAVVCGCEHVVAVANGTVALSAALEALGVGPGDEVLTTPFTFVATVNAALQVGANVRFADIRDDDFNLDPAAVRDRLTPNTRAVIAVHLYGQMADLPAIADAVGGTGALLVEDAAQAHGAELRGRPAGSFGAASTFSLYATKNVMAGEGGLIGTNDARLADRLRLLRNQGMRARYSYEELGGNYRLTDMQAAIALPQVARLGEMNRRRARNAATLSEGLAGVAGLVTPAEKPGRTHVWHQYTVRVTAEARLNRDGLAEALLERGVQSGVYYPRPIYEYDVHRDHPRVDCERMPVAERVAGEVLSLPVHPYLGDDDLAAIVAAVRGALDA
jgi:perosamine synthetase